jgi:hypothetical protein
MWLLLLFSVHFLSLNQKRLFTTVLHSWSRAKEALRIRPALAHALFSHCASKEQELVKKKNWLYLLCNYVFGLQIVVGYPGFDPDGQLFG